MNSGVPSYGSISDTGSMEIEEATSHIKMRELTSAVADEATSHIEEEQLTSARADDKPIAVFERR